MTDTPVVTEAAVRRRLAGADGLLVALDFDGTLAPIADDPDEPTITDDNRTAVTELAEREHTTVAVVSGRQLADLRPRVGVDGVRYVGNHGLEYTVDGSRTVHPDAEAATERLGDLRAELTQRLDHVPELQIEDKELTLTVHYRRSPDSFTEEVQATVDEVVADHDGLVTTRGKEIVEVRPDIDWDKGAAVELLREDVPESWAAVYVGDDVTDEDAFRVLGADDLAVYVGDRETAADFLVPEQTDVAEVLGWLDGAVPAEG